MRALLAPFAAVLISLASAGTPAEPLPAAPTQIAAATLDLSHAVDPARIKLRSSAVLVVDPAKGSALIARNVRTVRPIASITKLMTAMVTLDAKLPLDHGVKIVEADVDHIKGTGSRLRLGTRATRRELLRLALMASENRAAAALARSYPGGTQAFVAAMNRKAAALGMTNSRFRDSTGLSQQNVSTAQDLARMVLAARKYTLIRQYTTTARHTVKLAGSGTLEFRNSNRLVQTGNKDWRIGLSKTGYTAEAGRCLVMEATIGGRPLVFVLLNSWGKLTPIGDANRIRRWMEANARPRRVG
ncbi:MAG TPA: D-alanyl-D-alanine endopeptidase [Gammaproteobacteria bacterium]|nr:D-alanyl-D-alanine endopeptidase [Gammaproteobacteria bacterium]